MSLSSASLLHTRASMSISLSTKIILTVFSRVLIEPSLSLVEILRLGIFAVPFFNYLRMSTCARWPNIFGVVEVSRRSQLTYVTLVGVLGTNLLEDANQDSGVKEVCRKTLENNNLFKRYYAETIKTIKLFRPHSRDFAW